MLDRIFHIQSGPYKLIEIAKLINIPINENEGNISIKSVKPLDQASTDDLTFLNNKKYINEFKSTKARVCIVAEDFEYNNKQHNIILLRVKNPYYAYSKVVNFFYKDAKDYSPKIMPSAYISPKAIVGKNCYIGHNAVIEDEAQIGDDSIIEAGTFIDYKVCIGKRAKIHSNVSISHSIIGDNVIILSGAKIGQDGFGFATEKGVHYKIYHTGRVIIGNDVEIGANTTIDRGSMNDTEIGDLCRIDNLVQIAHNVKIGKGSIIVAQVGIAGSSIIGDYCALGGQVGISGHVKIGNKVQIVAQSGVMKDVEDMNIVAGTPAISKNDWHRQTISLKKLINKRN